MHIIRSLLSTKQKSKNKWQEATRRVRHQRTYNKLLLVLLFESILVAFDDLDNAACPEREPADSGFPSGLDSGMAEEQIAEGLSKGTGPVLVAVQMVEALTL